MSPRAAQAHRALRNARAALPPAAALLAAALAAGCASTHLNAARENFYLCRFDAAAASIAGETGPEKDRCLLLMERGLIRQARGDYAGSVADWLAAAELAERLDRISVSRQSASLLINDSVTEYAGAPYERTLSRAFAALSYLAMRLFDDAAVEARNIVSRLENLDGFPDDAFSRYVAGFCLGLAAEPDNAALQYEAAARAAEDAGIDPRTGRLAPAPGEAEAAGEAELVCFVFIGRSPSQYGSWTEGLRWGTRPYAEIHADGRLLGRSRTLTDTALLLRKTNERVAVLRAARTATRVAVKEIVAHQVSEHNELLGELIRFLLFALEAPDARRWETLPRWLQVARVRCPANLESIDVVFRDSSGAALAMRSVSQPLVRRDGLYIAFCRDLAPAPAPVIEAGDAPARTEPAPRREP